MCLGAVTAGLLRDSFACKKGPASLQNTGACGGSLREGHQTRHSRSVAFDGSRFQLGTNTEPSESKFHEHHNDEKYHQHCSHHRASQDENNVSSSRSKASVSTVKLPLPCFLELHSLRASTFWRKQPLVMAQVVPHSDICKRPDFAEPCPNLR